ncbi:unnamed protein product [Malus baccata var. baccata]
MDALNATFGNKICFSLCLFGLCLLVASSTTSLAEPKTHKHEFVIQATPVKRLCKSRNSITVNGQFPGPTLEVNNGDTLVVKVTNRAQYNVTIHWHGIRQMRTGWADGPEFVTQCPIRPGGSYTYRFTIQGQEGTLWWHAHSSWLRATVYGALIIHPKQGDSYPFTKPKRETTLLLGEWWNANPINVLRQSTRTGGAPNVSDAYTINGQPGDLYNCSSKDTVIVPIDSSETNLLRVINAALNQPLFFSVANHKLTVVSADASYTKPFTTTVLMLGPGQTTDVLITGDQPPARYYLAARAYFSAQNAAFDNTTTTAILEYKSAPCSPNCKKGPTAKPIMPQLPAFNDTNTASAFTKSFRSPRKVEVPTEIDENLFFTIGLGLNNCPKNFGSQRCQGPNGTRFTASMNNVSFVLPNNISILQAYQQNIPGVFTTDFPANPPRKFDYTGNVSRSLWQPMPGTRGYKLKYGSRVQVVLQDTSIVTPENHPIHLHGYDFYILAEGFGNFNAKTDTKKFNLVDPPMRNTVAVPANGWAVIRFVADNPAILLGEWWDANPIDVVRQATRTGAAPNVSDAYTINGQPGDLYNCSSKDTVIVPIDVGETNLLRVINAALNQPLFFSVANHKLTVVSADASYTKPFTTTVLMLGPGQTTDVLITGDQPPSRYYLAASAYFSAQNAAFDNTTTTAILEYRSAPCSPNCKNGPTVKPIMPQLPAFNDTNTASAFTRSFRSPRKVEVPTEIDENLFFTVGLGLNNCPNNFRARRCQGPNGTRFTASMNNVSFVFPTISILQAYQQNIPGVFTADFPANPPLTFDYTGNVSRSLWQPTTGTRGYKLKYGSRVQIVLQDTSIVTPENHPIHLHGYDFYILAEGFGNFNAQNDTKKFNLVDPPMRNTVAVPVNGWAVIRFVADNPGAWLMHCHLDVHITWGLAMVFLVDNGVGALQSIEPPPADLPLC